MNSNPYYVGYYAVRSCAASRLTEALPRTCRTYIKEFNNSIFPSLLPIESAKELL